MICLSLGCHISSSSYVFVSRLVFLSVLQERDPWFVGREKRKDLKAAAERKRREKPFLNKKTAPAPPATHPNSLVISKTTIANSTNMSNISRTGNSTTQACAACKYQRRKCAPDCILAPYFPHNRQRQFLNAHKLFGVSNISKIIKNLNPPEKDEAMRTIIFQSDVRANDPVGGCYRMIRELQRQIEYTRAELDFVLHQLAIYRAQAAAQQQTQLIQAQAAAAAAAAAPDHQTDHDCQSIIITDTFDMYDPVMQYHDQYPQEHQDQQEFVIHNPDNNQLHLQDQDPANAWATAANVQDISNLSISSSPNYLDDQLKQAYNGDDHCSTQDDNLKPILDVNDDVNFEPDDQDQVVDMRFVPSTQLLMSS